MIVVVSNNLLGSSRASQERQEAIRQQRAERIALSEARRDYFNQVVQPQISCIMNFPAKEMTYLEKLERVQSLREQFQEIPDDFFLYQNQVRGVSPYSQATTICAFKEKMESADAQGNDKTSISAISSITSSGKSNTTEIFPNTKRFHPDPLLDQTIDYSASCCGDLANRSGDF